MSSFLFCFIIFQVVSVLSCVFALDSVYPALLFFFLPSLWNIWREQPPVTIATLCLHSHEKSLQGQKDGAEMNLMTSLLHCFRFNYLNFQTRSFFFLLVQTKCFYVLFVSNSLTLFFLSVMQSECSQRSSSFCQHPSDTLTL